MKFDVTRVSFLAFLENLNFIVHLLILYYLKNSLVKLHREEKPSLSKGRSRIEKSGRSREATMTLFGNICQESVKTEIPDVSTFSYIFQ